MISRNLLGLLVSIFVWLPSLAVRGVLVQAAPLLNVGLTRFEATPLDNAARLEWDTQTELGTAGFTLKRGQSGSFDYLSDSAGKLFIFSEGGPTEGYDYAYTDESAVNGESYTYQLVEILTDASEVVVADTTVTIGIVPTSTPIVVSTSGNNGNNTNSSGPTETATSFATIIPSPTPLTNRVLASPATPIPTHAPAIAASVVVAASDINPEAQSISDQPLAQEDPPSDQSGNSGAAVAFAQEDPANYPGPDSTELESGESLDIPAIENGSELERPIVTDENPDFPEIIGTNTYPADNGPSNSISDTPNAAADTSTSTEGKIYLWVAFIAALVIFTAAVLGAILLYTRQRNQE